jgi:LPS sulfotransferase NodH
VELVAAAEKRGPLSFEDRVCLLLARESRWTCVTNEKPLHRACKQDGVTSIWGLRLMINLVQARKLTRQDAMDTARAIQAINPRYITGAILRQFEAELH